MMRWIPVFAAMGLASGVAHAADREFCPDRPGLASPPCTMAPGSFDFEMSGVDYSHSRNAASIEDDTVLGDMLLRYGIAEHAELRFGWRTFGIDRSVDRQSGAVDRRTGSGDVTIGIRRNLTHPDGDAVSVAIQPFVTLPVGGTPVGAGTWSAGVLVPVSVELSKDWKLAIDPEIDAAANQSGDGRHLAYSMVTGLTRAIGKRWQIGGEVFAQRDEDPSGYQTVASLDADAAYALGDNAQIDLQANAGLTSAAPRVELILGFATRF